ncbi:MAG: 6,7-dimethyl-8-ribityllumazine synthase [Pseudomonadota bacterium]
MTSRVLILTAKFNDTVTRSLELGARQTLEEAQAKVKSLWVPGAFELPVAAQKAAKTGNWDAIVCLGCVIRGETPHFDLVSSQVASGIMKVSLDSGIPVIFGVLATDTVDQAMNRSGLKLGNKGVESAHAALAMVKVLRELN